MVQTKDPNDVEQLAIELHSVAIHLLRRVRQADRLLEITPARLSALSVLVFGGPRTLTQLADAEQVAGPTMSRIVAALERDGLIRRAPADDRRAVRLSATPAGRRLMMRARRRRVQHLVDELRTLPAQRRATLQAAVAILRALERS